MPSKQNLTTGIKTQDTKFSTLVDRPCPALSENINYLCRLQLYTDVHGHITNLDKEVCLTNVFVVQTPFSRFVTVW